MSWPIGVLPVTSSVEPLTFARAVLTITPLAGMAVARVSTLNVTVPPWKPARRVRPAAVKSRVRVPPVLVIV